LATPFSPGTAALWSGGTRRDSMPDYVIATPAQAVVPTAGGGLFPVRRIFCVGRNYAAHAREMGHDPERELPFFFTKPADAVLTEGADMPYPAMTSELHHEMEQVVAIGRGGADIAEADALSHVWGYGAGLDMTRRDLQAEAKKAGRPWDMAKGFDHSAPIGVLVPALGGRSGTGADRVAGERRGPPVVGPSSLDLERAGNDRVPVAAGAPGAGRPDLHRNARGRRRGRARRRSGGRYRRRRKRPHPDRVAGRPIGRSSRAAGSSRALRSKREAARR